jgi:small subunit ribosomal protein S18
MAARPQRKLFSRKKVCRFCVDKELTLDYKDYRTLRNFVTERGKIIPRRILGTCATHQRQLCSAVKKARQIALLPYSGNTQR